MKLSLVVTVLNEEKSIDALINSVVAQTKLPQEIIFVDGESSDKTIQIILRKSKKYPELKIKLFKKKGNRSVGRNKGIKNARGDIILSTDAGCFLHKKWIENITRPFRETDVDVVAGYYKGSSINIFQKSLIPYVLVMEDRIDEHDFLPATRSMAFKKSAWFNAGGFDENLAHNEDYAFSVKLKKLRYKIKFEKKAIVFWFPRSNFKESFIMFFRFALGDIQANILRPKVVFIYLRYICATYLILLNLIMKSYSLSILTGVIFAFYIIWSMFKNYKYVKQPSAIFYLPLLQIISDLAIILGSFVGFVGKIPKLLLTFLKKKYLLLIILVYVGIELSIVTKGIPSQSHPFTYFMDEWHQFQSVRNVFTYGTPNIEGSANGSMLHFFLTGLYLIPFQFLGVLDIFSIKSSVYQLLVQQKLFIILRLNTIMFGVGSILLMYFIANKFFKSNSIITLTFFVFNPAWIVLSNYFKYDIALIFWILISFIFCLYYFRSKKKYYYILFSIFSSIALSVKVSAIALIPVLIIAPFIIKERSRLKLIAIAFGAYFFVFVFFGVPDLFFGRGNIYEYLDSNLIRSPSLEVQYDIKSNFIWYFVSKIYPLTFGHILYWMSIIALVFVLLKIVKSKVEKIRFSKLIIDNKSVTALSLFLVFFLISIIPLRIEAYGNRILVILPFMAIGSALLIKNLYTFFIKTKFKYIFCLSVAILLIVQISETMIWYSISRSINPRESSSDWINNNLLKDTTVGIENIPIYQFIPDVFLKEYYTKLQDSEIMIRYEYSIIDYSTNIKSEVLVISNADLENNYGKNSNKKKLLERIKKEGYVRIFKHSLDLGNFKFIGNTLDYHMTGLLLTPSDISIYKKSKILNNKVIKVKDMIISQGKNENKVVRKVYRSFVKILQVPQL